MKRLAPFAMVLSLPAASTAPWLELKQADPAIPRPNLGLGYSSLEAVSAYARALAKAAPDRVQFSVLNVTEEGREQPFLVISSPRNMARLQAIRAGNTRLTDPRTISPGEADRLILDQPVIVWLGYSVHGNEASGTEAALAAAYQLLASRDPEVAAQLDKVVVLLDLSQNPDGRARHLQAIAEATQDVNPSDPQDAQNGIRWPGGRYNHRYFDLNRDWAWQTQGETQAKVRAFLSWAPQVFADHHEMSPESSYFFPPTMQPVHDAIPRPFATTWQVTFGEGLAKAFDAKGFAYFTKEVFDLLYPGYGDSWPSFHGAVGMTFEMAGQGGLAYKRRDGDTLILAGRIERHLTASLATVATAATHREAILRDFHRVRREQVEKGTGAFVIDPNQDSSRAARLRSILEANGIEVGALKEETSLGAGDFIGLGKPPAKTPAGSLVISLNQPHGGLAQALLEKEAHFGPKPSYDATAWSLPLLFGLPTWRVARVPALAPLKLAPTEFQAPATAFLIPANRSGREAVLVKCLKAGAKVRVLTEPVKIGQRELPAGTLLVVPPLVGALPSLPWEVVPVSTGLAQAGPDLGSDKVSPVRLPRVALLMESPAVPTAFGAALHTLREAGIAFTQLRADRAANADLNRYTHLILVDDGAAGQGWKRVLGEAGAARLKAYAEGGGVIIGFQGGASYASRVGLLEAGFRHLTKHEEDARQKEKDPKFEAKKREPGELTQPWGTREDRALQETLPGALLRVKVDATHPLAWGISPEEGCVFRGGEAILELSPVGENPVHHPKGPLKVSGLVPKAIEEKFQETAYALREHRGRGAVIAFAGDPVFRGMAPITERMFLNALFFGAYQARWEE